MAEVECLYPPTGVSGIAQVAARATAAAHGPIHPFDPRVIAFLDELSKQLFRLSRAEPALAPLAFFLRRSATTQLAQDTVARLPGGGIAVPQGVVLHIPPTNVDTLFLYTLAIALLTGNSNVVRISPNAGPATDEILALLFGALDAHPEIAPLVTVVRFSRDDAALQHLTDHADVRMIWGGDASIDAIRRANLQPHAKDLAFPDRLSIAAIDVSGWERADAATRSSVAEALYNDTYWFDQMACSSPQQLILVGEAAGAQETVDGILGELARISARLYDMPSGQAINKMVAVVESVARGSRSITWTSNESVSVDGLLLQDAVDIRPGGGFFSTQHFSSLGELAPQITRRVQTLATFGIDQDDLREFVTALNGRGIDRIVPIGSALDFNRIWDGKDLVSELLRLVTIA